MGKRTSEFLILATNTKAISEKLIDAIAAINFNYQQRIMFGLGKKMYLAFNALISDAEKERSEAVHHLKTLVESYIYFAWIGNDLTHAQLFFAKVCENKIGFFKANANYNVEAEVFKTWEDTYNEIIAEREEDWKKFKKKKILDLAGECNLTTYYNRIYKLYSDGIRLTVPPPGGVTV